MPTATTFPPNGPVVTGGNITLDLLLAQPTRITRRVANLLGSRLLADKIFAAGSPAVGGAVIFDRVLANDVYTSRDVQEIEPGSEFPIVDDAENTPGVAMVAKRGGQALITYEAKRRNALDVMDRKLVRLTNTIARKIDTVSMAVLDTDPNVPVVVGTAWSNPTTGDPITDIATAASLVYNTDLGYTVDTCLINPAQELSLFRRKDIRDALPREGGPVQNQLLSGKLSGLMGLNWYVSNRVPAGTAYFMHAGMVGSMHDELPLYTRVVDMPLAETFHIMAARVTVPVITDPFAAIRYTGLT